MLTTVEYLSLLREYMRKNAAKYGISRMVNNMRVVMSIFVLKLIDLLSLL